MFTILIVEADIQQSTNMKETLNELDENLIVYEAQSKEEALYISSRVLIDIFYVDMDLKDFTGIDFAMASNGTAFTFMPKLRASNHQKVSSQ